ncbi:MAG: DoxX family protein [Robiginitomaculum sp.]|nr:DoxX family protein [Robiginitomaculum sp.]
MIGFIKKAYCGFENFTTNKLPSFADLAMRLVIARMFFKAGWVKLKDQESATDLFQYEWLGDENWWMLLIGAEEIPRTFAMLLGLLATAGEIILPVLLVLGLFTRFAATGLMVMTLVIITLIYPVWTEDGLAYWWNDHAWWAVILLALMAFGGQKFSLDHWLKSRK